MISPTGRRRRGRRRVCDRADIDVAIEDVDPWRCGSLLWRRVRAGMARMIPAAAR